MAPLKMSVFLFYFLLSLAHSFPVERASRNDKPIIGEFASPFTAGVLEPVPARSLRKPPGSVFTEHPSRGALADVQTVFHSCRRRYFGPRCQDTEAEPNHVHRCVLRQVPGVRGSPSGAHHVSSEPNTT